MPLQYMTIKEVTPQTKKWAVKVQVVEKSPPQTATKSSTTLQRLVLLDKEGTRVQTTIFGADIKLFEGTLKEMHKYQISNALVKPIEPKHRYVNHVYQWIINSKTPVMELLNDEESSNIKPRLSLVHFSDLPKYADVQAEVDLLAIVIDMRHKKQIDTQYGSSTIQEFVIMNEEMLPTLLTLWNTFAENDAVLISGQTTEWPLILAMRLKVSSYNRLSVSTKFSSSFLVNPDIEQARALKTWAFENQAVLREMKETHMYHERQPESFYINDIPEYPDHERIFKVLAFASIKKSEQKFWYMSCDKCLKPINAEYKTEFPCVHCRQTSSAQPRCCFQIELRDHSGTMPATIYGKNAEKVFPFTAVALMEKESEEEKVDINSFGNIENHGEFIFHLKRSKRQSADVNFNIVSFAGMKVEN